MSLFQTIPNKKNVSQMFVYPDSATGVTQAHCL